MARKKLWSYSAGQKGINRIRVYERRGQLSLYREWYDDDGRHQEVLKRATGYPVNDKAVARRMADHMSHAQLAKYSELAEGTLYGANPKGTLRALLAAMHADRGPG